MFLKPKKAEAAWFDDNFAYRTAYTFNNSGGAVINQKVLIQIDTATLITNSKLQSNCEDSRFTDASGNLLEYYINTSGGAGVGCNDASSDYYVLMPTIVAGNNLIYHYYGNPQAVAGTQPAQFSQATFSPASGPTTGSEEKGTSPTLYYKFDDGTGTTAQDETTNNLDGTLNNTPTWQTEDFCVAGKCLYFDGTTNMNVSKSDDPLLDFVAADNFTVQAWVKRNGASSANNFIITKAQAGYTGYKLYQDTSGDYCFDVSDGTNTDTACTSAVEFDDDNWHQVVGVKAGTSSITLYVDGNQRAQDASIAATGTLANTGIFYVGVDLDGTSNEWLGFIDEVKVYKDNTARTAAQVAADYNARSNNEGAGVRFGTDPNNLPKALNNGLVGYWKMDEGSGNTCSGGVNDSCDSSGNANDGAWTNQATTTAGKFGNGTIYDGADDYTQVADANSLDVTNVTIAGWINATALGGVILQKATGAAGTDGYYLDTSGSKIRFCATGGCASSSTTLSTSTWTHIAVTFDGTTTRFYLNGALNGTATTATSIATNALVLQMGVDSASTTDYNGKLDDMRVYNRALSPAEITQLYNFAPGPVLYWKLDENTGTTAYDSSGNANNSTSFNGNTAYTTGKYGGALTFDGVDDNVRMTETSSIDFGALNDSFTVAAWFKTSPPANSVNRYIVAKDAGVGTYPFSLHMNDITGAVQFVTNSNSDQATGTSNNMDNQWHYATGVRDRQTDTIYLYVDGVLEASANDTAVASVANNEDISIGNGGGSSYTSQDWQGLIDDVKIYNYARTPKQIIEDMNAGHPAPGSPLGSAVAYWKLNEGYGTTANDNNTITNHSLTLSSASWTNSGKFGKAWNGTGALWLSRADDADFDFGATEDFTISMWFKSDSATNPGATEWLLNKSLSGGTQQAGYAIYANTDGTICFAIDDDATWTPDVASCTTADFYDATWHHVVGVRDTVSDKTYIYVDAIERDSDTDSTTATLANARILYLGDRQGADGGDEFNGDLDEVKIFRSALNPTDIKIEYNRGSAQVLGALSDRPGEQVNSAAQEYCIPGQSSICNPPQGRWNFEEGYGTTAYDSSTNNNTGTFTNGAGTNATWSQGRIGKAVKFNETLDNQWINVGSGTTLDNLVDQGNSGMTISFWLFPTTRASTFNTLVAKDASSTPTNGFNFYIDNNSGPGLMALAFQQDFSGANNLKHESSDNAITLNTWQFVTLTYDGSITAANAKIYVNGQEVSYQTTTDGVSNRLTDAAQTMTIGADNAGASSSNARIDQVRVYNYIRSQAQIQWDYNRGAPVGWWKMDECQGTTINDSAGNSLTGTWSGSSGTQTSQGDCTTSATTAWYSGRTGKYNSSLNFDGADDVVSVSNDNDIDLNNNLVSGHSFSTWVYADSAGEGNVGQIYNKGSTTYLRVENPSGSNLDVTASLDLATSDASLTVSAPITTGSWNHIVVTWTDDADDELTIYINGVNKGSSTNGSGAPAAESNSLFIGGNGSGASNTAAFDGQIDDFRVYNYELTATQVKILYNQGAVRFGPSTGSP